MSKPLDSRATAAEGAPARLPWRAAEVMEVVHETPRVVSLALRIPGWPGHLAGQHVDVRLTGDGYQAQRLYSIASAPEAPLVWLTVERIEDGEVSPYFVGEVRADTTSVTAETQPRRCSPSWAKLIAKVYQVDPLVCVRCGQRMSTLAFVSDQHSIKRILEHLGLRSPQLDRPPPPAREILRVAEQGEGWRSASRSQDSTRPRPPSGRRLRPSTLAPAPGPQPGRSRPLSVNQRPDDDRELPLIRDHNAVPIDTRSRFLQDGGVVEEPVVGGTGMATLNVKNLPDALYRKLQRRARESRRSVAQEVTLILEEAVALQEPLSILELRGLGKGVWRETDAAAHVDSERRAWD
jgi:hypothetical protein